MEDVSGKIKFRGDLFFLSNFYPCDIKYGNLLFNSSEALYQALKCPREMRETFTKLSAKEAMLLAHSVPLEEVTNQMRIEIMKVAVTEKFRQHPDLAERLISTRDENLCEINTWRDMFYGIDAESGEDQNWLGKILITLKKQLAERNGRNDKQ